MLGDALIAAGVARVVAAMQTRNPQVAGRGLYRPQQAGTGQPRVNDE